MSREMNREERALQFVYEHGIDAGNLDRYEARLRSLFDDEDAYRSFVHANLGAMDSMYWAQFFAPDQHVDAFFHPRFARQTPHLHDFYELKYQLSGNGTVVVDDDAVWLRESDCCLIAPFMPHLSEIFDMHSEMINIVMLPEFLPLIFPHLSREPALMARAHLAASPERAPLPFIHIRTGGDPEIRALVEEIYRSCRERASPSPVDRLCAEAALERIFLRLLRGNRCAEGAASVGVPGQSRQVKQMMDYLQAHLRDANIESFARHLHYSPSYASRFFKRCTGQTFSDALRALRLKRAAQLLNEGELSVDEVMELVGYSGRTNFYASFRRCYGSTPSAFRREHAQKI